MSVVRAVQDCPRRNSKAASEANDLDSEPMAVAAFVGEEIASTGCARKTQCLHPDKPMMFACAASGPCLEHVVLSRLSFILNM